MVAAAEEPDHGVPGPAVAELARHEVQQQRDAVLGEVLQLEGFAVRHHVPVLGVDVEVLPGRPALRTLDDRHANHEIIFMLGSVKC